MILAINTSTQQFGIAFLNGHGSTLAEYLMPREKGHFGSFMPALDFVLSQLKASIRDVRAVCVAIGPGSFTGLRVGLSAAKGLCHGLSIPIIGVSSLHALAFQAPYSDLPISPVIYSRSDELFTARFFLEDGQTLKRIMDDTAVKITDLSSVFDGPSVFIGNDFVSQEPMLRQCLGPDIHVAPGYLWNLRASAVGALGLIRLNANDFNDPLRLDPIYIRPPDIKTKPVNVIFNGSMAGE